MNEYFEHEEVKRLFKISAVVIGLLGLLLVAKSLEALKEWQSPSAAFNTIVVSGTGEAFATPDIASFSFSVSADAKTVAEAQKTVTAKANAILDGLKNLGVDDKDIRTTDYSVYPKYTYQQAVCSPTYCPPSRQIPDGFTVTHTISVKIRKTDDAGAALSLAGEKGATNISALAFTVDDPNAVESQARDKAIKDAKTKAQVLAKSLGVRLGRVVDFSDSSLSPRPYPLSYKAETDTSAGGSSAPTLPIGESKVTSNVSITYEIR